ncbi:hypothetical protein [Terrilactibacillus laevilacticus]|uniref:hypothetical protein n=1 Tax=Terrilactibacillus laevilacticus TaxID=1380157 RepID=UPI001147291B|nr:hypothetical protein [Terrilactibacillus laevilacticus]
MKNELAWSYRVMFVIYVCLLIIASLLWILLPVKSLLAGFVLGMTISFYNIFHMTLRVRIASVKVLSGSHKLMGLKSMTRFLMVTFGALLVYKLPAVFDFRTFVFSLLLGYLTLIVVTTIETGKQTRLSLERRENIGNNSKSEISRDDV